METTTNCCPAVRVMMGSVVSIVVASLVSITGIIGFVGLVVPHVVRLFSRTSDNRIVMPMSALFGAKVSDASLGQP